MSTLKRTVILAGIFGLLSIVSAGAVSVPKKLLGDWSLDMESGMPAWMSIVEEDGETLVYMRFYIGPSGPYKNVKVEDGRIQFEIRRQRKNQPLTITTVDAGLKNGKLKGTVVRKKEGSPLRQAQGRPVEKESFTGKKISPMPPKPDLSKVRFGSPVMLFNGKDLTGWRAYEPDKLFGWSVKDGVMVNTTPKTDFSATGAYANLRTVDEWDDFYLHIEFLVGEQRNSGVYLKGMYEAQVVDRDSRMQGMSGPGAIFGTILPSHNAGRVGGEWQSYDIILVDRHVTVILNGQKVIDNEPIRYPTAGAIYTNPDGPGPIYLQGDHTAVQYRNVLLAPVVEE
jgi:hypothetical protein